jgi:Anti-sigma-K factor rskA
VEEVLRGIRGLVVLGALAALAYVAYRLRAQLRERLPGIASTFPATPFEPAPFAAEAPAGPVAMVVPMDDATPAAPVAIRVDSNGSPPSVPDASGHVAPAPVGHMGPIELPPARRLSAPVLAALAAVAGVAAIALATTALVKSLDSDDGDAVAAQQPTTAESTPAADQALSLLSKPSTQRLPIANSGGRVILAVGGTGRGVLVLDGLGLAPSGKAYQAWVIKPQAKAPASAAVFSGTEAIVPLSVAVKPGSVVAITIERAGGVQAPTQTPKLVAQPAT